MRRGGGSAGGADAAVHKVQDVEMGNRTSNPPANNTSASHFLDEEVGSTSSRVGLEPAPSPSEGNTRSHIATQSAPSNSCSFVHVPAIVAAVGALK